MTNPLLRPALWLMGGALSLLVHGGLAAVMLAPAAPAPLPDQQELGIKGRELIELAPIEMLMAAPETDLASGDVATDSAASYDSPEKMEEAKAAKVPVLAQIPYAVEDPELQFRIANPDDTPEAETEATEITTQLQEDISAEPAPPSTAASPDPSAGQDAATGSTETEIGLTAEDLAEVGAWQKSLMLALAQAKTYPKSARNARAEGKVTLTVSIDSYGRVQSRRVEESSGWPALDQAALRLIDGFDRLPAPPGAMGTGPFDLRVPIAYRFK